MKMYGTVPSIGQAEQVIRTCGFEAIVFVRKKVDPVRGPVLTFTARKGKEAHIINVGRFRGTDRLDVSSMKEAKKNWSLFGPPLAPVASLQVGDLVLVGNKKRKVLKFTENNGRRWAMIDLGSGEVTYLPVSSLIRGNPKGRKNPWLERVTDPKTGKSQVLEFMTFHSPLGTVELSRTFGAPTWKLYLATIDEVIDVGSGSNRDVHQALTAAHEKFAHKMPKEPEPKPEAPSRQTRSFRVTMNTANVRAEDRGRPKLELIKLIRLGDRTLSLKATKSFTELPEFKLTFSDDARVGGFPLEPARVFGYNLVDPEEIYRTEGTWGPNAELVVWGGFPGVEAHFGDLSARPSGSRFMKDLFNVLKESGYDLVPITKIRENPYRSAVISMPSSAQLRGNPGLESDYDPREWQVHAQTNEIYQSFLKKMYGADEFMSPTGLRLDAEVFMRSKDKDAVLDIVKQKLGMAFGTTIKRGQTHGWFYPGTRTPSPKTAKASQQRYEGTYVGSNGEQRTLDDLVNGRQAYEETIGFPRKSGFYRITQEPTAVGPRWFVWPMLPGQREPVPAPSQAVAQKTVDRLNKTADPRITGHWRAPEHGYTKSELSSWLPPAHVFGSDEATRAVAPKVPRSTRPRTSTRSKAEVTVKGTVRESSAGKKLVYFLEDSSGKAVSPDYSDFKLAWADLQKRNG